MILSATQFMTKVFDTEVAVKKAFGKEGLKGITDPFKPWIEDLKSVVELLKTAAKAAMAVHDFSYKLLEGPAGPGGTPSGGDDPLARGAKAMLATPTMKQGDDPLARVAKGLFGSAPVIAPAHATGGVVAKPAPGEYFASVAPGEAIVPAGGGRGASGGGTSITIPSFSVIIQAGSTEGRKAAAAVADVVNGGSFRAQLVKALEDVLKGAGVPAMAAPQ
jgi:hypothetical protein